MYNICNFRLFCPKTLFSLIKWVHYETNNSRFEFLFLGIFDIAWKSNLAIFRKIAKIFHFVYFFNFHAKFSKFFGDAIISMANSY